jgi:hypothetical protein
MLDGGLGAPALVSNEEAFTPTPTGGGWISGVSETVSGAAARRPIKDGLYFGRLENLEIELRVDSTISGIVSADIFSVGKQERRHIASLRTEPGACFDGLPGHSPILAQFDDGPDDGVILIFRERPNPDHLVCVLGFDEHVIEGGSEPLHELTFHVTHQSPLLRQLTIEVDREANCAYPPVFTQQGKEYTVESVLAEAGIDVSHAGRDDRITAAPKGGWSEKDLPRLMTGFGQALSPTPAFHVQILWLSKSNRPGLLGVMFDTDDDAPRQALAVFSQAIQQAMQDAPDWEYQRRLVHTTVHEIGHALNLAHRFEPEVGRADSFSCMNYDWLYAGGGQGSEYWKRCRFHFDPDELDFIRHGPWRAIAPGGEAFHSVRYWDPADDPVRPEDLEERSRGLRLSLVASPGPIDFGQPVVLGVELTNGGALPIELPDFMLDQKAGFLAIRITRLPRGRRYAVEDLPSESFSPIVRRCYDLAGGGTVLAQGESKRDNVNVTFGDAGFPFAEPGDYAISAVLAWGGEQGVACKSEPVTIQVSFPKSAADERDGTTMLDPQVGRLLAGFARSQAVETLTDLYERRAKPGISDGLCAHAARALMFEMSRRNKTQAAQMAKYVLKSSDRFDPHTFAATRSYLAQHAEKPKESAAARRKK